MGDMRSPVDIPAARALVVNIPVCEMCIRGEGGECHTPGCSFFMFPAPPEGANSLGYDRMEESRHE